MRRTTFTMRGWAGTVTCWEEPGRASAASQDSWLAVDLTDPLGGECSRLAAIDGVTPTADTPCPVGADGAVWAAAVVRTALTAPGPLEAAVLAANQLLFVPGLPGCDQPAAAVAAVDITAMGLEVLAGGDSEVWARRHGAWEPVFRQDMLAAEARSRLDAWKADHPRCSMAVMKAAEEDLHGSIDAWNTTPLGRFAAPKLACASVALPDELILATDGARLTAERAADLEGWLMKLRSWEEHKYVVQAADKRHDDVTVLHLRSA